MFKNKNSDIQINEKSTDDIIITDADSTDDEIIIIEDDSDSFLAFVKRHKIVFAVFGFVLFGLLSLPFLFHSSDDIVEPVKVEKKLLHTFKSDKWVLENDMLTLMTQNDATVKVPWDILGDIENILSWSIGLSNLRKDDEVYIVWSVTQYEGEDDIDTKEIAGLLLKSHDLDTTLFAVKFTPHQGNSAFFDYEGIPWKRQFLRSPVKYAVISSRYDLTRLNPYLKKIKDHRGTDYAAPEGAEVLALADGIITQRTRSGGSGKYVKVKHDKGYATAYLHLSRFRASLKEGDTVRQGDVIGYVGATGNATGPHVCLRFWRGDGTLQDDFVSAFPYLPKPPPLPFQERERFFERRDSVYSSILMNE